MKHIALPESLHASGFRMHPASLAGMKALGLGCLVALSVSAPVCAGGPVNDVSDSLVLRDAGIDAMLTAEAQRLVRVLPRVNGQRRAGEAVGVEAWMDLNTGKITVNFDAGYLPDDDLGDWDDLAQNFRGNLDHLVKDVMEPTGMRFLFDGHDVAHYNADAEPLVQRLAPSRHRQSDRIAVSAGHGAYYHHGYRDWRYQRDRHNGIIEDEVTPLLADSLRTLIEERSGKAVQMLRSSSVAPHEQSGYAWWMMGARYAVKDRYPHLPGIWNSLPNSTLNSRERLEDIRSRPLLANHEGVDTLVSLHTNGADSPAVRGALVFVYEGRPRDHALAKMTLCYMKEIITAQPGYADFPVAAEPRTQNHGENRIAVMSAMIVESAFHTNAQDALALQDPVFREAAMKGVEKGVRLFSQGAGCTPLRVLSVMTLAAPQYSEHEIEIRWEGHPQYPLRIEVRNVACPSGWGCADRTQVVTTPSDGAGHLRLGCNDNGSGESAPVLWAMRLVDADGVATKEMPFTQQCAGKPGMRAAGAGAEVMQGIAVIDDVPVTATHR